MWRRKAGRPMNERPVDGRPVVERSRFAVPDLVAEALAGIVQRPARTLLTVLGTVLGVGAFTAVLGLTATASGQVSTDFTSLAASQVTVNDVGDAQEKQNQLTLDDFPAGADARIGRLNGVVVAGRRWAVFHQQPTLSTTAEANPDDQVQLSVYAASPGYLRALGARMGAGTLFNTFHDNRRARVAVLGAGAAEQLHLSNLASSPAVFVNGTAFTVIGIVSDVAREPDNLLSVLIPAQTATQMYGAPQVDAPASMLIETRVGAAALIARQAPMALRPDDPQLLESVPPPDPHQLQQSVLSRLNSLFLMLAGITLIIGAVGIANTTLVAVMERVGEIGLRRALGARPRHIAGQFLAETTVLGTAGGLVGAALGIGTVLAVALVQHWTAVLNPVTTVPAPLIGTVTGLLSGAYPAIRAAHIEPLEALRR